MQLTACRSRLDGQYYVDTWSRIDQPPVAELRRAADRSLVPTLEKGDASRLRATGLRAPEPFVAKGRDGKTDIWGIIVRPSNFDPAKKYPVIEYIYAGPHDSFVPKTLQPFQPACRRMAELGFIVVQIDGMGTSNRSKAFHDVAWQEHRRRRLPRSHPVAQGGRAKYPWYDITRVGIYGGSAGGQNATGRAALPSGLLQSRRCRSAGCHDNRMDKIWWNEQWMGWPIGPQYAASSNVENASNLQGKLLLLVGELDNNVDPSSTMQVVNALIKATRPFDFLFLPGKNHGGWGDYWERKREDFFVRDFCMFGRRIGTTSLRRWCLPRRRIFPSCV